MINIQLIIKNQAQEMDDIWVSILTWSLEDLQLGHLQCERVLSTEGLIPTACEKKIQELLPILLLTKPELWTKD